MEEKKSTQDVINLSNAQTFYWKFTAVNLFCVIVFSLIFFLVGVGATLMYTNHEFGELNEQTHKIHETFNEYNRNVLLNMNTLNSFLKKEFPKFKRMHDSALNANDRKYGIGGN